MGEKKLAYTVESYLEQEQKDNIRYQFIDGEIYALAGGSINHAILCSNILFELKLNLKGKPCIGFSSEIKVNLNESNSFVYPDAAVVCGDIIPHEEAIGAITNPLLIVEVLSPSTEQYDRGKKFFSYRQIPSFKEYILIQQDEAIVEVYRKQDDHIWQMETYFGLDKTIHLQSIQADIAMADIYQSVEL